MSRMTIHMAASLDGFIARRDGRVTLDAASSIELLKVDAVNQLTGSP